MRQQAAGTGDVSSGTGVLTLVLIPAGASLPSLRIIHSLRRVTGSVSADVLTQVLNLGASP